MIRHADQPGLEEQRPRLVTCRHLDLLVRVGVTLPRFGGGFFREEGEECDVEQPSRRAEAGPVTWRSARGMMIITSRRFW